MFVKVVESYTQARQYHEEFKPPFHFMYFNDIEKFAGVSFFDSCKIEVPICLYLQDIPELVSCAERKFETELKQYGLEVEYG